MQDHVQRKRLWGWLSYAFASEVFAVCSLGLFLPIALEQFARDNGFLLPDRIKPCSTVPTSDDTGRCAVKIGWVWVDTASYSLYVYSASVAIQALTVISMGGVADHPPHRKRLLLSFALLGALCCMLFLPLSSQSIFWTLSALLAIVANVSFGASIVALNSYLPGLAKGSEPVAEAWNEAERIRLENPNSDALAELDIPEEPPEYTDDLTPLTRAPSLPEPYRLALKHYNDVLSRTTSHISSLGIALGYSAGITLLIIILVPVTLLKGSTYSLRLALFMTGAWWALFTIPSSAWLPGGEALQKQSISNDDGDDWSVKREILRAWKRLGQMLFPSEIKKLRNTFWFLAAWFLLSDGFTTITSTAVLFAKTDLKMPASSLILVGILTPLAGILGALGFARLQRKLGWTNLKTLVTLVCVASAVPIYGCIGILPWFHGKGKWKFGGLTTPSEMFVLAVYFGSIYGAFQGYARSVFADLIPPGQEARWYGLYSITDKSSSFFGPLVVGLIADITGNIRFAFFFLVFMMLIPVPLLVFNVDVDRGRTDAQEYSKALLKDVDADLEEERV